MPLTKEERDFLDAYVYEATHEPFGGPATTDLRGREIYYADLHGLLTAYHREACAKKVLPFGSHNPKPPPSPWADRDEALRRAQALATESTRLDENAAIANADSSPPPARAAIVK